MDYLAAMRGFVRAVDLGSFSRAAAEAGVKVSTVSRHVAGLEADLGAALLNRSTRRLHLTEVGAAFHGHATRILAELAEAREAAMELNARPQGLLRITMPGAFGRRHVMPHMGDFLAAHPAIRIDATLTDDTIDLIATGTDLAIRIGALADSSLVARRLAPQRRQLVASPAYLAARAPLREPADLRGHDCLLFALQPKNAWYFDRPGARGAALEMTVQGPLRANDSEALLDLAVAGLGIALLPSWLTGAAIADGRLTHILPAWEALIAPGQDRAIWAVYPPKKIVAPKVRALLSFLDRCFGKPPYWDEETVP